MMCGVVKWFGWNELWVCWIVFLMKIWLWLMLCVEWMKNFFVEKLFMWELYVDDWNVVMCECRRKTFDVKKFCLCWWWNVDVWMNENCCDCCVLCACWMNYVEIYWWKDVCWNCVVNWFENEIDWCVWILWFIIVCLMVWWFVPNCLKCLKIFVLKDGLKFYGKLWVNLCVECELMNCVRDCVFEFYWKLWLCEVLIVWLGMLNMRKLWCLNCVMLEFCVNDVNVCELFIWNGCVENYWMNCWVEWWVKWMNVRFVCVNEWWMCDWMKLMWNFVCCEIFEWLMDLCVMNWMCDVIVWMCECWCVWWIECCESVFFGYNYLPPFKSGIQFAWLGPWI